MKLVRKYPYKHYNRFSDTTGRKYLVDNVKVPSVTTILSATKDRRFLDNWRRKVGDLEADRIMRQASTIGTEMHQVLEYTLNGQGYYNAMEEGAKPRMMAKTILDNIKIDEVWGNEISLEYQNKYAGTCDLTAVAYGKPSVIDWKQSNKLKKVTLVEDNFYGFRAANSAFLHANIPMVYGIRMSVFQSESERSSKLVFFAKNNKGINNLRNLYSKCKISPL